MNRSAELKIVHAQLESLRRDSWERFYGGLYVNMLRKRCEYEYVLVVHN
jgi:hypothetical protein